MIFALTSLCFLVSYTILSNGRDYPEARSSGGERHPDAVDVQGSNPCVPTILKTL
jgi:hypothetical protein